MRRFVIPLPPPLLPLVLLILLPLALFLALFHAGTLDIGNAGWLIHGSDYGDNGENALGAHAYWHDPGAGTSLRTTLLNAPEGVPVLFTDSNPLVTLAAKPFAALLPADAQLVGPFILFNLIVQAMFAWLLLRRHAPGPVALWSGMLLLAFPPVLANRFVHANLMAHWTILAALWLFLDPNRSRRLRWWLPLIVVTALIHSYLLVMVGAIWASAMLVRFMAGDRRARLLTVCQGLVVLAVVAALARWLGVGGQLPTGAFGAFPMPLDALWNPHIDHFSTLLPQDRHYPDRWFEGFQYLGAGSLLLVVGAVIIARYRPARDGERAASERLRGLIPALVVLAILAIAQLPLPAAILTLLDPVRASGRLFWPVGYVLVLMALLAVFRLTARQAGLALVVILAIQIVDLSGMASAIRAQSTEADDHRLFAHTSDPHWDRLIARSHSIAFIPGDVTPNLRLFQEIAWRAIKAGRPVTNVYAARSSRATLQRLDTEAASFVRGELVPGRLYIVRADIPLPAIALPYRLTLDGVTVIGPVRER